MYCTCGHLTKDDAAEKQEVHLIRARFVLHPELLHKERLATRSQVWESTWMQRVQYGESTCKEMPQKEV